MWIGLFIAFVVLALFINFGLLFAWWLFVVLGGIVVAITLPFYPLAGLLILVSLVIVNSFVSPRINRRYDRMALEAHARYNAALIFETERQLADSRRVHTLYDKDLE